MLLDLHSTACALIVTLLLVCTAHAIHAYNRESIGHVTSDTVPPADTLESETRASDSIHGSLVGLYFRSVQICFAGWSKLGSEGASLDVDLFRYRSASLVIGSGVNVGAEKVISATFLNVEDFDDYLNASARTSIVLPPMRLDLIVGPSFSSDHHTFSLLLDAEMRVMIVDKIFGILGKVAHREWSPSQRLETVAGIGIVLGWDRGN